MSWPGKVLPGRGEIHPGPGEGPRGLTDRLPALGTDIRIIWGIGLTGRCSFVFPAARLSFFALNAEKAFPLMPVCVIMKNWSEGV